MNRILGYVDEISPAVVLGWIANLDTPDQLEPIICTGSEGVSAAFHPFLPRSDVCQALCVSGRFGFAIPTERLQMLGRVVRFSDQHGAVLKGGESVQVPHAPKSMQEDGPLFVMLHIPKTAGTSLRSAIATSFPLGTSVFVYGDGLNGISSIELGELPVHQSTALNFVMGHSYFGLAECIPRRSEYVTVLRDPEARLRSNYYHYISDSAEFHFGGERVATSRVVQHGLVSDFDNLMTRMIAGTGVDEVPLGFISESHVQLALRHLRTRFRFIGLTEHLDDHFRALCRAMKLPVVALSAENVRRVGDTTSLDAEIDWGEVLYRNRFDALLYERVQAEGLCGRDLTFGA